MTFVVDWALNIRNQSSLSLQSHRKLPVLSTQTQFVSCRKMSFMPNLTAMLTAGILSLNTSTNSIQSACLLSSTKWPMKGEQTLSRRGKKRRRKKKRSPPPPPPPPPKKKKLRRPDGIFQRAKCELKSFLFQNTLACAAGFHSKDKHTSVHQSCLFLMHNWCGELYNSRSELSNEQQRISFSQ